MWCRHGAQGADAQCFETPPLLITFVLLGKFLEASAKGKASQAMSELISLQPHTALRCAEEGDLDAEPTEVTFFRMTCKPYLGRRSEAACL